MKFVEYNHVPSDVAQRIMESYGYDVDGQVEDVEGGTEELLEGLCIMEREGSFFALYENVEVIDGAPFIPVALIDDKSLSMLDESSTSLMESVNLGEEEYQLGHVFQDEDTHELFVSLQ